MKVAEAAEMYLETILRLEEEKSGEGIHAIDLAKAMGYSKPTISIKLKQFKEEGYVEIDDAGHIHLLKKGRDIAVSIYSRHKILTKALLAIGVSDETASADACKIEHYISDETYKALVKWLNK